MSENEKHSDHGAIWKEINELKTEVKATREDVAFIRGIMEGKKDKQEQSFNWKNALTNAAGVGIGAIALIISVFYGRS